MQIKNLKPNKRNPRKISAKKLDALKKSVAKFGDLSGFVFNRRTGQLVSGHQRSKTIPQDSTIKIEVKHEKPTAAHTVAEGYVEVNGERFKYREVDAPESWEVEAMLAANKHGGEWDDDILRVVFNDFPTIDIDMAGFDLPELSDLGIDLSPIEISEPIPAPQNNSFDDVSEESDEEYITENPGPDSSLAKEEIDMVNRDAFEQVEEKIETVNSRQIIIIDCLGSVEVKNKVKEKLRTEDLETVFGVKIY